MPEYYFEVEGDGVKTPCVTLRDHIHARSEAILYLAEILRFKPDGLNNDRRIRVQVRDESSRLLFTVETRLQTHAKLHPQPIAADYVDADPQPSGDSDGSQVRG